MIRAPVCRIAGTFLVLVAALSGCTHRQSVSPPANFFPVPPPPRTGSLTGQIVPVPPGAPLGALESYPLRVGDQIGFTLHVLPQAETGDYRISVGDEITARYLHLPAAEQPELRLIAKPDGTIDLPMLGEISIVGKTVARVQGEVNHQALRYWKHPQIALGVVDPLASAGELRRAFSAGAELNQTLTLPVGPDGNLELPLIGTVRAFGRTLVELRDEVIDRYQAHVPGVRVTPFLEQRAPDRVYVLGEVEQPGMLLLERPTSVIQAISQSGSWKRSAELCEVVLIRGYTAGAPRAILLDLDKAIELEEERELIDLSDDLWLQDGDIVVVPKDDLENMNDQIERVLTRGFYGLIPPQLFIGVGDTL